jgi:hypothetical protein
MQANVVLCKCKRSILLEEMYPSKPTKKEAADSLMHSSIDIDQMIVLEAELAENSIQEGTGNTETTRLSLIRIKSFAEENSKKVREARSLVREINRCK